MIRNRQWRTISEIGQEMMIRPQLQRVHCISKQRAKLSRYLKLIIGSNNTQIELLARGKRQIVPLLSTPLATRARVEHENVLIMAYGNVQHDVLSVLAAVVTGQIYDATENCDAFVQVCPLTFPYWAQP